jgi:hypothetical protein
MKDEHKRLRLLLEEDDAKQKQQLKILSQQVPSSSLLGPSERLSADGVLQEEGTGVTETNQRIGSKEHRVAAVLCLLLGSAPASPTVLSPASSKICSCCKQSRWELPAPPFQREQCQWRWG